MDGWGKPGKDFFFKGSDKLNLGGWLFQVVKQKEDILAEGIVGGITGDSSDRTCWVENELERAMTQDCKPSWKTSKIVQAKMLKALSSRDT